MMNWNLNEEVVRMTGSVDETPEEIKVPDRCPHCGYWLEEDEFICGWCGQDTV